VHVLIHSLVLASILIAPTAAWAQAPAAAPVASSRPGARVPPTATAVRTETPPAVDGRLDDAAWTNAPVISTFTQRDPFEGQPVSETTEVRIAYDDVAIYIAGRFHDRFPVTTRLGRRDMAPSSSDWFTVSLDTFYDRRTAFQFEVNPSGVRRDAALSGGRGDGGDAAWDAVWDVGTSVDDGGWTAEMRIPFSQLGFAPSDELIWGLQLERVINRNQEQAWFAFTPKNEQSGVSAFGDLVGLRGLQPGRRLELLPYAVGNARFADSSDGGRDADMNAGLDARYRLTSNLTLTTTINPDFGQVEVDPAVINLTAFETRYQERRPFFVEGASAFRFGGAVGGPSAAAASVLYSRRFGRSPQIGLGSSTVETPDTATILGAAKISGKTASGWSLGVLNALTGAEHGTFRDGSGSIQRALVEPRTNYFVGRVSRDLRRGQSNIGGILTTANRDLAGDPRAVDELRASAYTGGLDFIHEFLNRSWTVTGFLIGSRVAGSQEAMLQTQRSSNRYLQRPDAKRLTLDPNATSMSGAAASLNLRKTAGLHVTTDSWIQMVSPGYEVNDVGFMQRTDRRAFGQGLTYREQRPGDFFRDWRSTTYINRAWNFDGDVIDYFYWTSFSATHLSYWQGTTSVWYEPKRTDDRLTRGGPIAMRPATWRYNASFNSDPRRSIAAGGGFSMVADRAGSDRRTWEANVTVRTSPRWNLAIGPEFTRVREDAQYVTSIADAAAEKTFGRRYVFAPLDQTQLSLVTRLNYTFTPDLTLEVYAQPLVSHGDYGTPKEFQTPRAYDFLVYGEGGSTIARDGSRYAVDPDGSGPLTSFNVPDRTFTTRSLRGNAVLRWEYRPGSTFYLVWQQDRENRDLMDPFDVSRGFGSLFSGRANNVVVLKWTYWVNP
jgi:hypothetical protein